MCIAFLEGSNLDFWTICQNSDITTYIDFNNLLSNKRNKIVSREKRGRCSTWLYSLLLHKSVPRTDRLGSMGRVSEMDGANTCQLESDRKFNKLAVKLTSKSVNWNITKKFRFSIFIFKIQSLYGVDLNT